MQAIKCSLEDRVAAYAGVRVARRLRTSVLRYFAST